MHPKALINIIIDSLSKHYTGNVFYIHHNSPLYINFVTAYHAFTEIITKSKLWVVLNESIVKSKAMIRDVTVIHRAVTSVHEPLS